MCVGILRYFAVILLITLLKFRNTWNWQDNVVMKTNIKQKFQSWLTRVFPISDLKRHFETDPYSKQVARGQQVEMRCHPPRGRPKPAIYWKLNGRRIDASKDNNYMITNEGHLIIVVARLSDTANYTCVAENIANLRSSNTAQLTVYGKEILY